MNRWISQNKNKLCYILAFLLPIGLMVILSLMFGFYPFGRLSVLVADLRYQFVDYYGYLKNVFFGDDTYFYTFSKTFGGDMAGFASYYLNNPFVFLLLFVPNDMLPAGVLLMIILLIGLSGLNFNLLINKVYGNRWASLIFSTAYSFMGFYMAYIGFTIYFFNIMLFPLVMLGLYNIIKTGKKSYLYIFTLFLSIFSNYYVGYMTCIFSLLFFIYMILVNTPSFKLKELRQYGKAFLIYAGSSLLAVGLSAFSLCSVVFSLQGQKGNQFSFSKLKLFNFNLAEVFSGLYSTAFHGNISDGLPIIYSSVIAVVFLFLFFMNRNIHRKEKAASILILAIMLLSFWSDFFNVVWHGFSTPIGFPYRNSFMFSFLLLFIAYKDFICIRQGLRIRHGFICLTIFLIYSAYLLFFIDSDYVGRRQIVITGAVFVLTLAGVYAFNYKKEYAVPIIAGLFMLQAGDLLCNGYFSIDTYFADKSEEAAASDSIDSYADFVDETTKIIDYIEEKDTGLYRIDKLYRRTHNDAMLIGYNGLSHFSSTETDKVKRFMGLMGFRDNGNWAFYGEGSTTFADCFMGLKYMLSQYDETGKPYEKIASYQNKFVYQNPYALGLAFGTTKAIKEIPSLEGMEDLKEQNPDFNHFEFQNEIADSFSNQTYEIYRQIQIQDKDIELVNVKEDITETGKSYEKIEKDKEAYIEYRFTADSNDFIFMYFNAPGVQDTTIIINGLEKPSYFSPYSWSVREVGYYNPGEIVTVRMYLDQDQIEIQRHDFYYEDTEELARWYQDASKSVSSINKESSSHLTGTVQMADDAELLVFSIPYEKDWTVKIDGKKVKTEEVLKCLLAAEITPGTHTIEMRYVPRGFLIGLPISVISFMVLMVLLINENKKKMAGK